MTKEKSAGGIITRHKDNRIEILLIRDMNGNWTFPKGIIEPNESPVNAAIREIKEEVGLRQIKILKYLTDIHYDYLKQTEQVSKTVSYFLFKQTSAEPVVCQKEEGISAFTWVTPLQALKIVGYPETNCPLIESVNKDL